MLRRVITWMLALGACSAVLIGLTGGCGEDDRPATWDYVYAAVIAPNCTTSSCHTRQNAQAGVQLQDPDAAYTILLGHPCRDEPNESDPPRNFVDPGRPETSRLMYLLRGDEVRRRMPPDRPLPPPDIDLIQRWILEGATCD